MTLVEQLREENSILREQLLIATEALRGKSDWTWPAHNNITPQMEMILRVIYKHFPTIVPYSMLYNALYLDRLDSDWPSSKVVQVQLCKLRRHLPPDSVTTMWGRGLVLTPIGKAWVDDKIKKQKNGSSK